MTKHETRATYENMIETFLQRNRVTQCAINERALTSTQIERAIRNDPQYKPHVTH